MSNLKICAVEDERDRQVMVLFPWTVYHGDRNWVPPIRKDRDKFLDPKRNTFFRQADVAMFVARRGDRPVGTIAAFIDRRFNEFLKCKVGFFGFFEVLQDYEAAEALLDTALGWVRERGMSELRGPINFHRDRERGILVEGADCPPPMMCGHSPAYYHEFVSRFGLTKYADDFCRRLFVSDIIGPNGELPPRLSRLEKVAERRSDFLVRQAQMVNWDAEVQRARELYDATIGLLPDHVPWTDAEFNAFADEVRPFIDPEFVLFTEREGRTVGCVLGFPDMNQVLIHLNGRLDAPRKLLAWWHMKRINVLSLKVAGVVEELQGRGIEALLLLGLIKAAQPRGYRWVDLSLQAEDNDKLTTLTSHFGAEDYKRYRVYTMPA